MDLLLWRHAEAFDASPHGGDMARALTARGEQQARLMAAWLARQLPDEGVQILCSPARRAQQTVAALPRAFETRDEIAPDASCAQLLELVQWPDARQATLLVVGHQPVLGQAVAQLLGLRSGECAIRKGAVWWLRSREGRAGNDRAKASVVAVLAPELL